jgi:hypothetical protein
LLGPFDSSTQRRLAGEGILAAVKTMLTYDVWQSAAGERYFVSAQHGDGVFETPFLTCDHRHKTFLEAAQCRDFSRLDLDEEQADEGQLVTSFAGSGTTSASITSGLSQQVRFDPPAVSLTLR